MAFEPETRRETAIMVRANGRFKGQAPLYRQARFSLVNYDGVPEQYIETRSANPVMDPLGLAGVLDNHKNLIERVEYYDNQPFDWHDFSDSGL